MYKFSLGGDVCFFFVRFFFEYYSLPHLRTTFFSVLCFFSVCVFCVPFLASASSAVKTAPSEGPD